MRSLCGRSATFLRLSTLPRVACEAGLRDRSVQALKILVDGAIREKTHFNEPFWPACARDDRIISDADIDACFVAAPVEQLDRFASHSSIFGGCCPQPDWLCTQSSVPAEMERRCVLNAARSGRQIVVPPRLLVPAPDHFECGYLAVGARPQHATRGSRHDAAHETILAICLSEAPRAGAS